jgi:hypothetical protein
MAGALFVGRPLDLIEPEFESQLVAFVMLTNAVMATGTRNVASQA